MTEPAAGTTSDRLSLLFRTAKLSGRACVGTKCARSRLLGLGWNRWELMMMMMKKKGLDSIDKIGESHRFES